MLLFKKPNKKEVNKRFYEKVDSFKIGNRLKALRSEKGETTMEMAQALGISASAVTMYETGNRIPRDEIKVRIAEHFGVSVESIFFPAA